MTATEKHNLEAVLTSKRIELIQTIRATTAKLALETPEADLIDHVQGMAARDEVAMSVDRSSTTLEQVDRALRALSDGSYGICETCEEPIAAKRLKTIPWAVNCVHCQERLEIGQASTYSGSSFTLSFERPV